jgi:hypothetical protein
MSERDSGQTLDEFHACILDQAGAAAANESPQPGLAASREADVIPYGAIVKAARWRRMSVPVCWENASADADAREWTRDAVATTWQKVSRIELTGWQQCAPVNKGIRIEVADIGPHVVTLGRFLDGRRNGMVLNFDFHGWGAECAATREHCIRAIAVHEFGHALGFTHEQNRPDAPGECRRLRQGNTPDTLLTPYDPDSVMNYCNKVWNNDGFLSDRDTEAAQDLYGARP